jgi:hypothetical protein
MTIESFIEEPDGSQQIHQTFDVPGSGHLYASYPNGTGAFEAIIVHCTGENEADVIEIQDGNSLELGFDPAKLPEDATIKHVDADNPYQRDVVAPQGLPGSLVVRKAVS